MTYESQTAEQMMEHASKIAKEMADFVNSYDSSAVKVFYEEFLSQHKTLQQRAFSKLFLGLVEQIVNMPEYRFDGRNEAMKKVCEIIFKALYDNCYADVQEGKKRIFNLPFI